MTRRQGVRAEDDPGMQALVDAGTRFITLVGKTWDFHVTEVLRVTLDENLAMIADSVGYLRDAGRGSDLRRRTFLRRLESNPEYALAHDSRGGRGRAPDGRAVRHQRRQPARGNRRDDRGWRSPAWTCRSASIATTIATWPWPIRWPPSTRGAVQVQGTINGIGERCGNADLVTVIANLALKKQGYEVLRPSRPRTSHRAVALRLRNWPT